MLFEELIYAFIKVVRISINIRTIQIILENLANAEKILSYFTDQRQTLNSWTTHLLYWKMLNVGYLTKGINQELHIQLFFGTTEPVFGERSDGWLNSQSHHTKVVTRVSLQWSWPQPITATQFKKNKGRFIKRSYNKKKGLTHFNHPFQQINPNARLNSQP